MNYSKFLTSKFISGLIKNGKKSSSEAIFYNLLNLLQKKYKSNPIKILWIAIKKIKPSIEVVNRRKGGKIYQVPQIIKPKRQIKIALKWLIDSQTLSTKKSSMDLNIYNEVNNILLSKSECLKKKEKLYRLIESNRAFLHYRW
uniref:Ribosomal protein S7 n=1 Tax=Cyanophora sudae TaxID=1522369 RepID=A0A873WRT7_9EUKA|nr:ribosomal protein S7 [Cyanophora sudae]QPB15065.1 ribosomal protein S7 [Cyanophora sudae]